MAESFYTILTNIGKGKIANSTALGVKVNLTTMAIGDGGGVYYNPTQEQTALKKEVWRGAVSSIKVDEANPNWIVVEAIIPSSVGGFMVREVAIIDDADDLIGIGKYPETYKPMVSDGSAKDLYVRFIMEVSNASSVTLKIDPSVVLATKKDVLEIDKKITDHSNVSASTTQYGHVKLNNSLASDNTTEALTAAQGKVLDEKIELQKADIKSLNKVKKNVTILTMGWIQDNTMGLYKYKIEDVDITADTIVDINIKLADLEKASDFKSANESFLGYVEIYSDSVPTANISCDLKIQRQVA
ncbi:phage tail protein [Clostridium cylindrosporum]|uniref:Phage tail-collar fiber protein n=1 Tax=Clostridium cylindrosporum DSM 605 TaxID=1121307 RepID=A0A0J8DFT2_CLOCY|nr:phage tail protein [Clostridium cylindrosporum]KMT23018.1 phage tail-collar fiber protein [Clostridium cylindrosporum DSM 605]